MKLILIIMLMLPLAGFSLENCQTYPDLGQGRYNAELTEISPELSYGGCPESVLVSNKHVANLFEIAKENDVQRCIYKVKTVAFICDK